VQVDELTQQREKDVSTHKDYEHNVYAVRRALMKILKETSKEPLAGYGDAPPLTTVAELVERWVPLLFGISAACALLSVWMFTARSPQVHCKFTATSLQLHCNFTATSLQLHCNFTATSLKL